MFCEKCGANISDEALFCKKCGAHVLNDSESVKPSNAQSNDNEFVQSADMMPEASRTLYSADTNNITLDKRSPGLNILSFFFPVIGLILFLVNKDTLPIKAKSIGKSAIIGVVVDVVLTVLLIVVFLFALPNIGSSNFDGSADPNINGTYYDDWNEGGKVLFTYQDGSFSITTDDGYEYLSGTASHIETKKHMFSKDYESTYDVNLHINYDDLNILSESGFPITSLRPSFWENIIDELNLKESFDVTLIFYYTVDGGSIKKSICIDSTNGDDNRLSLGNVSFDNPAPPFY